LYCWDLQPQGPRSRAFYYIRNSLLHTWNSYYTEPPMKVPITHNPFQARYNAPPPIVISLGSFSLTALVCSSFSGIAPHSPFFSSWWQRNFELFTHTLVLQSSPSMSSHQPQTTRVFADSRIRLLCDALRICVAHAPPESCSSFLLLHWAFRACYRNHFSLLQHASLPQNWSVQTSIKGQPPWVPRWCFGVAH